MASDVAKHQLPNRVSWKDGVGAQIRVQGTLSIYVDISAEGTLDSIANDKIAEALEEEARAYRQTADKWRALEGNLPTDEECCEGSF